MKILSFFLFFWVIFALLDPDPDPAAQINANPDPDPKPCVFGSWRLTKHADPDPQHRRQVISAQISKEKLDLINHLTATGRKE
jgi:hypothetical protein